MAFVPQPAFVGYEPNQGGPGYFFKRHDGRSFLGYGPEADRLRAQIDQAQPPDMRLASADAAPAMSMPDTPAPMMSVAPPTAPVDAPTSVESQGTPEPVRQGTTVVERPHAGDIPPPPPPGAELPPLPGGAPTGPAAPQAPAMQISPVKYVPGRNPAKEAATAVAVPTQQSVVTEGGVTDPEARKQIEATFQQEVEANQKLAQAQEEVANTQMAQQRAEAFEAQRRMDEAQAEVDRQQARRVLIDGEYKKGLAIAEKDYADANKKTVDQYQLFRGKPGALITASIAAGLGAFGAVIGRTQNFALDTINRQIDNSIEAQRTEIQQGIAKSGNDLKRLQDKYNLDTEDAMATLKLNYARGVEAQAAKRTALLGTQQAQLAFAQAQPTFQAWQAGAMERKRAYLEGKIKTVEEARMVSPSQGGFVARTPEEMAKEAEARARISVAESTVEHGGQKPGVQAAPKTPGEITPNLSRAAVATDNALQVLHELKKKSAELGYTGQVTGKIARLGGDTDYDALVNHGAQAIASMESNGMAPDVRRVEELEQKLHSMNPAQRAAHIESLIDIAKKKRGTIKEVSSKTAKVGTISGEGGGGRGEE